MLSCLAVEHLRKAYENTRVPVLCIYLDHKEQNTQTSGNLIGGLLRQLLEYRNYAFCSSDLINLYNRKGKRSRLTKKELQQAFCNEICTYERYVSQTALTMKWVYLISCYRVIVVVDALDEGAREVGRFYQEIMSTLPLDRLSVMVTSREGPSEKDQGIRCSFGDEKCESGDKPLSLFYRCDECVDPFFDVCYSCHTLNRNCGKLGHELVEPYEHEEIYLKVDPPDEVIREFVKAQIHGDVTARRSGRKGLGLYKQDAGTTMLGRLCKKHPGLEDRIIDVVVIKADGRFQLAKLYIDTLREQLTAAEVDTALIRLPRGYGETYDQTVERIMAKGARVSSAALAALSWVVHAHRPLDLPELGHALAIKPGFDFSVEDTYDKETLLEITESLLMIDSDDKAVRLTHYTAQDYFVKAGRRWLPSDASALIARACLQYFSIQAISTPCSRDREEEEIEERKDEYPFLKYAYEYWGRHVQEAGSDPDTLKDALQFLKNDSAVETLVQALWYIESSESSRWEIRRGANALHVAAWFGLTNVLSDLKSSGLGINAKDPGHEQTPLMYASRRGHADTVAKLIQLGASVNLRSARGDTAIVEAVREGHAPVVHVLLKHAEVKINDPQIWQYDRTILMGAIINANTEILDVLLARKDLEVNQADLEGLTALHLASYSGKVDAVSSLLAHPQLDINARNRYGYTALFYAAECSDEDAAIATSKLLLERRAKTFYRDKTGGATAIMRAVDSGYFRLVEYLLEQRAFRLGEIDSQGRGLLHAAAVEGQSDMAEKLILRYREAGIEVDTTDNRGRTPLHDACRAGSLPVVALLTDSKANPLIEDHAQRNCLQVAWQNGHNHIVDYFTDPTKLLPDCFRAFRPNAENLPLWSLAKLGERRLVTTKVEQPPSRASEQVDPDTGNTPVYCAVLSQDPAVLDLLLKAGLSPATPNGISRYPLHEAAIVPNIQLTITLLDHNVNVNVEDAAGTTPIRLAYASNHFEHALFLIEAGANVRPKALILPLFFKAIEYGFVEAVRILINKFHAPVLIKNKYGESALTVAKANGRGEIMRLLVQNRSVYYHERVEGDDESEEMDLKKMDARGAFSRPEIWDEVEEDEKEILATEEEETGAHSDVWPSLQGVSDLAIGQDQQTRAEGKQLANEKWTPS
ncbi:MAG: hypothetical protein OHK93_008414 [Ramalina farinacea]|uniref:Uncharacterized protein n=1 Tax=Ramalina farinacea TaxID=258253 RepID=A0AA43TRV8_9LECA|nr:hypothetical protein [Ramalina farinacea]